MTVLTTQLGKIRTGSTRPFIAVIERPGAALRVHARAETLKALETRLRREGFLLCAGTGLFIKRKPGAYAEGVWVPGELIARVEVVARVAT